MNAVAPVQVDTESRASELRDDTRKRAHESLGFFLTSVLGINVPDSIAYCLQGIGLRRLAQLSAGVDLWLALHNVKPVDMSQHETLRWLFPGGRRG